MGVGFTNSEAHWSYGGFRSFREKLASCIGIDLNSMQGFGGIHSWDKVNDPIKPFLAYSYYEDPGVLTPKECKNVSRRLRQIVEHWENCYDKQTALTLAEDMQRCANNDLTVVMG